MALETKLLYSWKGVSTSLSIIIKLTQDNFSQIKIKDNIAVHVCFQVDEKYGDVDVGH